MNKKTKNGTSRVVNWVLNIIIVVLSFFFILTACVLIEEISYEVTPNYSEDSFYYNVESERYFNMIGNYYHNTLAGFEGNKNMREYYGVAQYYEAASLYKAYTVAGNTEQAEKFLQKMKEAESEMGGWSIAKEPIHKQLGIE